MANASNVVKIKANGGDRAANLEGIADAIDKRLTDASSPHGPVTLTQRDAHTIKGYMEQLRIIANELREGKKVERGDFPPHNPIGELD